MKMNTKANNNINDNKEKLIVVKRANQFDDGNIVFDMIVNDITIYGCRLIARKDGGVFVAFPQRKGRDGGYYSIVYAKLTEKDTKNIVAQIEKM